MVLKVEKGEIILPQNFTFEITRKNPFFSNEGSSSAPATLPAVRQNLELLGHPEDTHKTTRQMKSFEATLSSGLFFANCKLVLDSTSEKNGIAASLALNESVMYSELQNKKLVELFMGKIDTLNEDYWDIYHGDHDDPVNGGEGEGTYLCVFPVATDQDNGKVFVVNEPNSSDSTFIGRNARTVTIKGESVSVGRDYGLAPFVYLWALIEQTFKLCGYTVSENVFRTGILKDIVVLHQTVDVNTNSAWNNDLIRYPQMVPDITVGDFINWLRDKFGAIVCAQDGDVSIRLFRDIVQQQYDLDLTAYLCDEVTVTHPDQRRLEIEVGTDIESAAPAADSLEDLIDKYAHRALVDRVEDITGTGLFYVLPLGKFYYKKNDSDTPKMVGTDAYKYTRTIKDIEVEGVKTDDSFVPTIKTGALYMPYIGDSVRKNRDVAGDMNREYSQPFLICYGIMMDKGRYCGSSIGYDEDGVLHEEYKPLTPEGLYAEYWQKYHDIILNGAPELSCKMAIPTTVLLSMDIVTPKLLNGDIVLIKDLKYNISEDGTSICDVTFQQLTTYTNAEEIPNPQISGTLRWKIVNTRSVYNSGTTRNGIKVIQLDGVTNYTTSDAPSEVPTRAGVIAKRRKRWLRYIKYESGFLWHSETTMTHYYEEYFISTFNG